MPFRPEFDMAVPGLGAIQAQDEYSGALAQELLRRRQEQRQDAHIAASSRPQTRLSLRDRIGAGAVGGQAPNAPSNFQVGNQGRPMGIEAFQKPRAPQKHPLQVMQEQAALMDAELQSEGVFRYDPASGKVIVNREAAKARDARRAERQKLQERIQQEEARLDFEKKQADVRKAQADALLKREEARKARMEGDFAAATEAERVAAELDRLALEREFAAPERAQKFQHAEREQMRKEEETAAKWSELEAKLADTEARVEAKRLDVQSRADIESSRREGLREERESETAAEFAKSTYFDRARETRKRADDLENEIIGVEKKIADIKSEYHGAEVPENLIQLKAALAAEVTRLREESAKLRQEGLDYIDSLHQSGAAEEDPAAQEELLLSEVKAKVEEAADRKEQQARIIAEETEELRQLDDAPPVEALTALATTHHQLSKSVVGVALAGNYQKVASSFKMHELGLPNSDSPERVKELLVNDGVSPHVADALIRQIKRYLREELEQDPQFRQRLYQMHTGSTPPGQAGLRTPFDFAKQHLDEGWQPGRVSDMLREQYPNLSIGERRDILQRARFGGET